MSTPTPMIILESLRQSVPDPEYFDGIIDVYKGIKEKWDNGERIYVGYANGERAGSIAYIKSIESDLDSIIPTPNHCHGWTGGTKWNCYSGFHAKIGWDGRRNVIQCYIGHGLLYFPEYEGPTVWKKFDKKAAEKAALESIDIKDRDGNVLAVGDRVLYINARYGSGAQLDRGTITDLKIKVRKIRDGTYQDINVLIDNDDGDKSKITGPGTSVLKI